MLTQKGLQHLNRFGPFCMGGKIGAVAQMAAAAHHGQVDTGFAGLHHHGQDVHVAVVYRVDGLLVQHFGQSTDLVTHLGGLLKLQALCIRQHACL